jgi:peptidoglycan/LPS O-acetylase OafA/YrhL
MIDLKKFSRNLFLEITETPEILKQSHFPSLDGFRGLSIIFVIVFHINKGKNFLIFNGGLGVAIFFVISGFLITTLLIKEKTKTKNISLKRFYIRRFLRIFPVAYLYILVIIILNFVFHLHIGYVTFFVAGLYIMNFSYFLAHYNSLLTQHFWSLSVEEQFYLFFPYLLKKNFKIYLTLILFIVFVLPVILLLGEFVHGLNHGPIYAATHYLIKFQSISVGCLCAVMTFKNFFNFKSILKYKLYTNMVIIASLFFLQYDQNYSVKIVFVNLLISFLVAYLIISNIISSNDYIFKFLNSKIMGFIGVLSYSLYIWQQLFTTFNERLPSFVSKVPFNIILLFAVACISYYFYERKFLKLKDRFEPKNN